MTTEEQIIHSISESVSKFTSGQDDRVNNERFMRALVQKHRAMLLAQSSMNGILIDDSCFQYVGEFTFSYLKPRIYKIESVPSYITFENRYGLYFQKNGNTIPIVNSEEFDLSKHNKITRVLPKIKRNAHGFHLFIGNIDQCGNFPPENEVIQDFNSEIENTFGSVKADLYAVLTNPDDGVNYNFTTSVFPFPSEYTSMLTQNILYREFNIILQAQADKITDGEDKATP